MDPRYPIGRFVWDKTALNSDEREALVAQIAVAPATLRNAVAGLTPDQRGRMGWDA